MSHAVLRKFEGEVETDHNGNVLQEPEEVLVIEDGKGHGPMEER